MFFSLKLIGNFWAEYFENFRKNGKRDTPFYHFSKKEVLFLGTCCFFLNSLILFFLDPVVLSPLSTTEFVDNLSR